MIIIMIITIIIKNGSAQVIALYNNKHHNDDNNYIDDNIFSAQVIALVQSNQSPSYCNHFLSWGYISQHWGKTKILLVLVLVSNTNIFWEIKY